MFLISFPKKIEKKVPLKRFGEVEDIASAAAFLCSGEREGARERGSEGARERGSEGARGSEGEGD